MESLECAESAENSRSLVRSRRQGPQQCRELLSGRSPPCDGTGHQGPTVCLLGKGSKSRCRPQAVCRRQQELTLAAGSPGDESSLTASGPQLAIAICGSS